MHLPVRTASLRTRMRRDGARHLSNPELLQLLLELDGTTREAGLKPSTPEERRIPARSLNVLDWNVEDIARWGVSQRVACRLLAAVELGRRAAHVPRRITRVECQADVQAWAEARLVRLQHEEVWVLSLDAKNQLRRADRVGQGGVHGCGLNPTDILRPAIRTAASSMVLVHNHPSGDPTPSAADVSMTAHVAQACELLGVPLLDHVVVAREGVCSVLGESAVRAEQPATRTSCNN